MEATWLYIAINIAVISIPFARSFESRAAFYKTWPALFSAVALSGMFFITWDIIFTAKGVWSFNPRYVSGIEIFRLPLGKWLFFITVPYTCIFIYEVLNRFWPETPRFDKAAPGITVFILTLGITLMIFYYDLLYTFWVSAFLSAFLAFVYYKLKPQWQGKFYRGFAVALIGFFIVNGILTGSGLEEEVVRYNELHFVGLRIGTIPAEDILYCLLLLKLNVALYEYFKAKLKLN